MDAFPDDKSFITAYGQNQLQQSAYIYLRTVIIYASTLLFQYVPFRILNKYFWNARHISLYKYALCGVIAKVCVREIRNNEPHQCYTIPLMNVFVVLRKLCKA